MLTVRDCAIRFASNTRKFLKACVARFDRESIAKMYLKGKGIEIGALHNPLKIPKSAKVKYVDRMSIPELRKQYPDLDSRELVHVDIIDDGEQMATISDSSQDFVVANHFLEHCQNPIAAISNMLRVLNNGGVLYLSIPDKRHSFDIDRSVTSIEHLLRDYKEGPDRSKRQHLEEWTKRVSKIKDNTEIEHQITHLINVDYSIHYHVWTQTEMLELILTLKKKLHFNFEVELFLRNKDEVIIILKKTVKSQKNR
jgi:predicted SAM-dependent methyltransferase